jgi:5-methyltetrahydrofolate--homocysteine methyltransferase
MDEARDIGAQLIQARVGDIRIMISPNAGLPQLIDGDFQYTGSPEEMAAFAQEMRDLGVDIIGACCGSTPAHIEAIRQAI